MEKTNKEMLLDVFDENERLKRENDELKMAIKNSNNESRKISELESENASLKGDIEFLKMKIRSTISDLEDVLFEKEAVETTENYNYSINNEVIKPMDDFI